MKALAALATVLLLAGCAGGPGGPGGGLGSARGRDRPSLPPTAQPTSVVATELAFARAARDGGQWAAFARYAAPGAWIAAPGVSAEAERWLSGQANPATADRWVPRQAWSSCDGSATVVVGTSVDGAGAWSRFTRVWQRQSGGEYRWSYTLSVPDAALTQARVESERERAAAVAAGEDAILVEAGNFIRAKVAACAAAPEASSEGAGAANGGGSGLSRDRTLRWEWAAPGAGQDSFVAYSWNGEGWDEVHSDSLAVGG